MTGSTAAKRESSGTAPPAREIGLVLGGGGARGFAHLGVLRALEEQDLRPAFIFGCSMGGLIGALAACGHDYARIQAIVDQNLGPRALAPGKSGSFLGSSGIARVTFSSTSASIAASRTDSSPKCRHWIIRS